MSEPTEFEILPKTVNKKVPLAAPVKNAVARTSIETDEYTATVDWNEENRTVTVTGKNEKDEDVTIIVTIGAQYAKVNGEDVKLDAPAFIENDRTYTPIRFISEHLGATVEWNESQQKIIITKTVE